MSRYADRFQADTYADDQPVGVFIDMDDADAAWIPERLFERLVLVGSAYSLHLLPLLGGPEPVTLQPAQVETLLEELVFLGDLLSADPLVVEQVAHLHQYLQRVVTTRPDAEVTVEGG